MLTNYHTHTTYCDGKNTAEQVVQKAIELGFNAIGFSGHGYTAIDVRYCMKDTDGYIAEITGLKEKYKNDIQIYLGIEEDAYGEVDRAKFDYIIGSSHYFHVNGEYFPVDSSFEYFKKGVEMFNGDMIRLAESYYENFCEYILRRKPDIIGHFDLITKFDELENNILLKNDEYLKLSEKYLREALKSNCIFELNTGAMARGYRTTPYPYENLLHILKKNDGKLILSSDSHNIDTLEFGFEDARAMLRDIGFEYIYVLLDGIFKKERL